MRSPTRAASWTGGLLALLLLSACGPLAQKSDLGPSLAPAAAVCPSQYSFEYPMTLENWMAPSWSGAFESWALDSGISYCGSRSLRVRGTYVGGTAAKYTVINHLFDGSKNLNGRTLRCYVYLAQTPPTGFKITMAVYNDVLGWGNSVDRVLAQGWNSVTLSVTQAKAAGIHFEIKHVGTTPPSYQTDVWIDEVTW